jgi:hypothetical protein
MMHDGVSLRTVLRGSTAVNGMTFATLLKIGDVLGLEHHPHHDGLWWRTLLQWEKVDSVLWRDHSKQVQWPDKFKTVNIDRYDGSSNPEKFIQVYQTIIEAARGDDRVKAMKANFLPMTLTNAARSWLINLPKESITLWD